MSVVWQTPPEPGRRRDDVTKWQARLGPFVKNPNQWGIACVVNSSAVVWSFVASVKLGRSRLPCDTSLDEWEFATRKNDAGTFDCYARYTPAREAGE